MWRRNDVNLMTKLRDTTNAHQIHMKIFLFNPTHG